MVIEQHITEPSLLAETPLSDITIGLSSLSIDPEPSEASQSSARTRRAKLFLLHPLNDDAILSECARGEKAYIRTEDGTVCKTLNLEYVNLKPLSQAWRRAMINVPPISHLTFDLSMPKRHGSDVKAHWQVNTPRSKEKQFAVRERDVLTLVRSIATGVKMRADCDVRFDVTYEEDEKVMPAVVSVLKTDLAALAEYKPRAKDAEGEGQGVGN